MIDKNIKNKDIFKIKEDILSLKKIFDKFQFSNLGQLEKTSEIKN